MSATWTPTPPPQIEPPPKQQPAWLKRLGPLGVLLATIGAKAKAIFSALAILLKVGPFAKLFLTGGSMLVSIWAYSLAFGYQFAVGFVILIFIHEMGHVYVAHLLGIPRSAPIFIPFAGALIMLKGRNLNAWDSALVGIGGPVAGTLGAVASWAVYAATGQGLFLGLAFFGFFINLFNLLPIYPMDGARILGAVSPLIWWLGVALLVVGFAMGYIHNFMIILLFIMGFPKIVQSYKMRHLNLPEFTTTPAQKWIMGLSYVGLATFLTLAMAATLSHPPITHPRPTTQPLAMTASGTLESSRS